MASLTHWTEHSFGTGILKRNKTQQIENLRYRNSPQIHPYFLSRARSGGAVPGVNSGRVSLSLLTAELSKFYIGRIGCDPIFHTLLFRTIGESNSDIPDLLHYCSNYFIFQTTLPKFSSMLSPVSQVCVIGPPPSEFWQVTKFPAEGVIFRYLLHWFEPEPSRRPP